MYPNATWLFNVVYLSHHIHIKSYSLPMWTYSLLVQQSLMGFVAEPHPTVDALGEGIHFEHNVRAPSGSVCKWALAMLSSIACWENDD
jgi:hypothetical protein